MLNFLFMIMLIRKIFDVINFTFFKLMNLICICFVLIKNTFLRYNNKNFGFNHTFFLRFFLFIYLLNLVLIKEICTYG